MIKLHLDNALPLDILQLLPQALLVVSLEGLVQLVNPAAEKLLGFEAKEVLGSRLDEEFPVELVQILKQATAVNAPSELTYYQPEQTRWLRCRGVQMKEHRLLTLEECPAAPTPSPELQLAYNQLTAIFASVPAQLGYYAAVRDEHGQLQDLRAVAVNQASQTRMELHANPEQALMSRQLPGLQQLPVWQTIREVIDTGTTQHLELKHAFDKQNVWFDVSYTRLGDGVISASLDITARKQLEQELREGQERLQAVFDSSTLALHVLRAIRDAAGVIIDFEVVMANRTAEVEAGTALTGRRMLLEWPHCQRIGLFDGVVRTVETGLPLDLEQYFDGDGFQGWYRWTAVKLGDGVASTVENITDRKLATADLVRREREQQQQLVNAVVEAQEIERRNLAESLHNGLSQQLYAVMLQLDQLPSTDSETSQYKQHAIRLLQDTLKQTRTLSHQLMPPVLADFGLEVALESLCRDLSTPQLVFRFTCNPCPELLPAQQLACYRIVQELANNIVKHAGATKVHVSLQAGPAGTEIQVKDNGRGFDPNAASKSGLGLQLMASRVELVGGELQIDSRPEAGTSVRICLPY